MAYIVQGVIDEGGLASQLETLRTELGRRRDALCQAMRDQLPQVEFAEPAGGYFVWATFPAGVSTRQLRRDAKTHGVGFTPGYRCAVEADLDRSMRLSFAFYDPDELREGVRRIARALAA